MDKLESFSVTRDHGEGVYDIDVIFHGLKNVKCLHDIYGNTNALRSVLAKVKIRIVNKTTTCTLMILMYS